MELSEEKISEYKLAFNDIDENGDGTISADDIKKALTQMGEEITDEEAQQMIAEADLDKNGTVDFPEFVKLMHTREQHEILEAFNAIDNDGSGRLSRKELKDVMKSFGGKLSDEELEEMFKTADADGDGQVDYQEFLKVMAGK
jgi:calmodulin